MGSMGSKGLAGTVGTEADYESRRFYGSLRAEEFRGKGFEHASFTARAGVSPPMKPLSKTRNHG